MIINDIIMAKAKHVSIEFALKIIFCITVRVIVNMQKEVIDVHVIQY